MTGNMCNSGRVHENVKRKKMEEMDGMEDAEVMSGTTIQNTTEDPNGNVQCQQYRRPRCSTSLPKDQADPC